MIEKRTEELINRAIDGELSKTEQSELQDDLAHSDDARRYQAGISKLNLLLQELPAQQLPDGLHETIVGAIKLPGLPARQKNFIWSRYALYGFTAAAGLLLAVGIYQFGPEPDATSLDSMVGTVAPGGPNSALSDSYMVEYDDLSSSANLQRENDIVVLNIEIESTLPVELNVDLTASGYQVIGVNQPQSQPGLFESTGQSIRFNTSGRKEFAVLLRKMNDTAFDKDGAISLKYSRNGNLITEGALIPGW